MWTLFQFFCHQKLSVAQDSPKNRLDPNWMKRICITTLKTKNKILLLCIGRLFYILMQHIFYFIAIPYLFSLSIPPEICLILVGLVAFIFGCFELSSFIAASVPIWLSCLYTVSGYFAWSLYFSFSPMTIYCSFSFSFIVYSLVS